MENFLAFYGDCFYPFGGMEDFIGDFETKEKAIEAINRAHKKKRPNEKDWEFAWAHIYSIKEKCIIHEQR